jgi:hypothetical protein
MGKKDKNEEQTPQPPKRVYRQCPKCKTKWVVDQIECDCGEKLYQINIDHTTSDPDEKIKGRYNLDARPGVNGHNCFNCQIKDKCPRCSQHAHTKKEWTCYNPVCGKEQKLCCELTGKYIDEHPELYSVKYFLERFKTITRITNEPTDRPSRPMAGKIMASLTSTDECVTIQQSCKKQGMEDALY